MSEIYIIAFSLLGLLIIILIILAICLYFSFKAMQDSFNKIGYIAREDTKRYFADSAEQAKDVYIKALEQNKEVILESMNKAVSESSEKMKGVIGEAEKQAAEIILSSHRDAESINSEAKTRAQKDSEQMLDETAKVIDWAMSQYIKENFSIAEHEEIIRKLITSYLNEQRN